ncbi:MAG: glycerate kinase [Chloroflexota bacterium]|nr:glycerate kinase [Chloroflexota bacterium]
MKVVVAPQAFKGTASAADAAEAMRLGVVRAMPDACVTVVPIADGGGGTVDALVTATGGRWVTSPAADPLGRPIEARWGVLGDGETAVIETAAASGLALLAHSERDPTVTTTRGTGDLIRAALESGYRRILVGLGDSATNDAGVGMAQALGFRVLDERGRDLPPGGASLARLASIDCEGAHPALASASVIALCDVTNPLCGPEGAAAVFGPQKGADPAQVALLDSALRRFAQVVKERMSLDVLDMPGAGAAGGLGAGLVAFCGAALRPGFEVVSAAVRLADSLAGADLVLTGEGRLDAQTRAGKGVCGVAALAREHGSPCVAAIVGLDAEGRAALGIDEVYELAPSQDEAGDTLQRIESAAARAVASFVGGIRIGS